MWFGGLGPRYARPGMTPGLVLLVLSQALAVDAAHPITRRAASTVVSSMRRCGMKRLALVLVVLVSACASPEVDRSVAV